MYFNNMHIFKETFNFFFMHKLLLKIQSFHIYLDYAKSLMFPIYNIAKDRGIYFFHI
jgi:hypothetical protein